MKPITVLLSLLAAVAPPAIAQSVFDENPACMERNGPQCLLRSDVVGPRVAVGAATTSGVQPLRGIPAISEFSGTSPSTINQSGRVDRFRTTTRQPVDSGTASASGDIGGSTTTIKRHRNLSASTTTGTSSASSTASMGSGTGSSSSSSISWSAGSGLTSGMGGGRGGHR